MTTHRGAPAMTSAGVPLAPDGRDPQSPVSCAAAAGGCDPLPAGVHADLGWALVTVLRAYARAADHAVTDMPGGTRGYRLLAAVARDCPRSQLALARHVGLDRTVVTYLLDDLTAAGWVRREPDPADRRARRVVATPAGTTHLDTLDQRLRDVEDRLLDGLDGDDRARLRVLLQRVALAVATPDTLLGVSEGSHTSGREALRESSVTTADAASTMTSVVTGAGTVCLELPASGRRRGE